MTDIMPRPRPPHLLRETSRHGQTLWYVRRGKGVRVRIRSAFGTAEFDEEYQKALNVSVRPQKQGPKSGTLEWLVARYRESSAWQSLKLDTRTKREQIFRNIIKTAGDIPFVNITSSTINEGIGRRSQVPSRARHFVDTMWGLFKWAKVNNHVKVDPTADVKRPPQKKTEGFTPWGEDDVQAYQRRWPIGTRERVWLEVLLGTGLRRGDAVKLGRQHVRDGVITIKTEKTGTIVKLRISPELRETLAAGPVGDLTFVVGAKGRPLNKRTFGDAFSAAARAAGVNASCHGVRKLASVRFAEAGCTERELEAVFGWRGGRMASHYTRSADQARLAQEAMDKLENKMRPSIPEPAVKAPRTTSKINGI
jgi:integrase